MIESRCCRCYARCKVNVFILFVLDIKDCYIYGIFMFIDSHTYIQSYLQNNKLVSENFIWIYLTIPWKVGWIQAKLVHMINVIDYSRQKTIPKIIPRGEQLLICFQYFTQRIVLLLLTSSSSAPSAFLWELNTLVRIPDTSGSFTTTPSPASNYWNRLLHHQDKTSKLNHTRTISSQHHHYSHHKTSDCAQLLF